MTNTLSTRQEQLGGKDSLVGLGNLSFAWLRTAKKSESLPLMRSALLRDSRIAPCGLAVPSEVRRNFMMKWSAVNARQGSSASARSSDPYKDSHSLRSIGHKQASSVNHTLSL